MFGLENLQLACIQTIVNTSLYVRRSSWLSPATQPDRVKTYNGRSDLYASRIFLPKSHSGQQKLPLVICVHGGGFMVNNPSADDPLARHLADTSNCIVISIDYRKAPQNKFPLGYDDVVELTLAIINDTDLPIDRSKIIMFGSSAGGNFILGAAQDKAVRQSLIGVAALYPLCDMSPTAEEKIATRPDPSIPDFLGDRYSGIRQVYLGDVEDAFLKDLRLSPTNFASREALPANVLLIGAEHDMLCHEAEVMAEKLAANTDASKTKTETGWRAEGVQWHEVMGQRHAFDHITSKAPEEEKARVIARDETYALISRWLTDVFSRHAGK